LPGEQAGGFYRIVVVDLDDFIDDLEIEYIRNEAGADALYSVPPGEYDFNSFVDNTDYPIWRSSFGSSSDLSASPVDVAFRSYL